MEKRKGILPAGTAAGNPAGIGEREESGEGLEYRERIDEADLPEEVKEKALKEVERLEKMPGMAAEARLSALI